MRVFIEEQKINKRWLLLGLIIVLFIIGFSESKTWNRFPSGNFLDILNDLGGFLVLFLVFILLKSLKLKTKINEQGIYFQYFPFHFSSKLISWNQISNCYVRNYNPIFEYGGWGLKFSFRKKRGKSYTVKGTVGLQIELKNGKKILIGTQKENEIRRILINYNKEIIKG